MPPVKLKICGITSVADAQAAAACGAEYLGFNFYPKSPRYLTPEAARSIIDGLPSEVIAVGVFVNEPGPERVVEILEASGARLAQLHGDEDADYCARVGAERVIKVWRVADDFDPQSVLGFPASAVLLDAYDKHLYGGTGRRVDWALAREVARLTRVFLAGGLSPENIAEAVRAVRPYAVDVASGVEVSPGVKDPALIDTFAAAVAGAALVG